MKYRCDPIPPPSPSAFSNVKCDKNLTKTKAQRLHIHTRTQTHMPKLNHQRLAKICGAFPRTRQHPLPPVSFGYATLHPSRSLLSPLSFSNRPGNKGGLECRFTTKEITCFIRLQPLGHPFAILNNSYRCCLASFFGSPLSLSLSRFFTFFSRFANKWWADWRALRGRRPNVDHFRAICIVVSVNALLWFSIGRCNPNIGRWFQSLSSLSSLWWASQGYTVILLQPETWNIARLHRFRSVEFSNEFECEHILPQHSIRLGTDVLRYWKIFTVTYFSTT